MNVQDRTRLPGACAIETWLDETICPDLRRPRSCGCGLRLGVAAAGGDGCLHGRRPRGLTLQALDGRLRRFGSVPDLHAECDGVRAVRATPSDPAGRMSLYLWLGARNAKLDSSDVYLMTPDGTTIAASNHCGENSPLAVDLHPEVTRVCV